MLHQSSLVRNIVRHGVLFARALSPVDGNVLFGRLRYCFCYQDFILGRIYSRLVKRHCGGIVSDDKISAANFINELIDLCERTSLFSPDP
jgi:hypothetical protein